ncbi:MAG TPA: Gfo/Idh/MocA family oxidoreductase [Roseomonas sp.]|nr:Gfo/Idh/MocA family oxidoreductase [Roseomonas sp.]
MASKAKFRVGVLGCGLISADHFRAWAKCRGASVVALCDPDLARAETRAREFGIEAVYTSPEAMLAEARLDLADIITPRQTHADLVRLAARHGVHALCEKPLCPTLGEASALVDEVQGRIRVMVNENWRFRAYFRRIGAWIQAGRLGTLVQVRLSLWRSNLIPRLDGSVPALQRQPFVAREQRYLVAESLIHELDTIRSLFGEVEVVSARLARASERVIGEDSATILLETREGMPVAVAGVLSAAGHPPRAPNRMEIAGTRCSVVLDDAVLRLMGAEQEEHRFDEDAVRQESFDASVQHFVDRIRDGGPLWTSAEDQLRTLALVERTYELAGPARPLVPRLAAANA